MATLTPDVTSDAAILPRPIVLSPETSDPLATEWLLTNGIGGFAMGTMLGVPTRRYHGLLVAAMKPPVDRVVTLHSLDERVTIDRGSASERVVHLTRFHFQGASEQPRSHPNLLSFERGATCVWRYLIDGVLIEKRLHLFHGRNAAEVRYTVRAPGRRVRVQARPLLALRNFHALRRRSSDGHEFQSRRVGMGVVVVCDHIGLVISSDAPRFRDDPAWWNGLFYEKEQDRGQDHLEDLYTPGEFIVETSGLDHEATTSVYATVDARPTDTPSIDVSRRSDRIAAMAAVCAEHGDTTDSDRLALEALCAAADEFVVPRGGVASDPYGHPGLTVIAGYPWFADWGRDAMIAVPGLLIVTGRHEHAARVLQTFGRHRRRGIIPNRFDDVGGSPHYNTADASLWFVHAVHELWRATGSVTPDLLDACLDIVRAYRDGTRAGENAGESAPAHHGIPAPGDPGTPPPAGHGDLSDAPGGAIVMDPSDGLILAGDEQTQLTWMDARRDGISFTPRAGKCVEINALWHHALRAVTQMVRPTDARVATDMESLAEHVAAGFRLRFWNPDAGCLFDLVPDLSRPLRGQPGAQIRPNQVFAASLPTSPLTTEQKHAVLGVVRRRLLTPVGLRTLDPSDPGYRPRYAGSLRERDEAYHNGTVWPWLLGAYVEAVLRTDSFSSASRRTGRALLAPLLDQVCRHCPGHLAEVYDGQTSGREGALTAPGARPDGCPAQAWSVAMTLRALVLTLGASAMPAA